MVQVPTIFQRPITIRCSEQHFRKRKQGKTGWYCDLVTAFIQTEEVVPRPNPGSFLNNGSGEL